MSDLNTLVLEAEKAIRAVETTAALDALKSQFLGPKGALAQLMKTMAQLSPEERRTVGQQANAARNALETLFTSAAKVLRKKQREKLLTNKHLDATLPASHLPPCRYHPLTQIMSDMVRFFAKMGFSVIEGPEIDTEWYCFEALNTPSNHPARDAQDTLYFPRETTFGNVKARYNEDFLLRTQTSTVQIRTMLQQPPPIRMISPGKVFRRDTVDATHSANFHQFEGLAVDKNLSVCDLKACIDIFARNFLGKNAQTRFRPSFFPFTEPSFEVDVCLPNLGKLSNQWIELFGCGMVDPKVFEFVGYNTDEWRGFAFGMGIERIAMILYGIDDLRLFYQNDLRFLRQFA